MQTPSILALITVLGLGAAAAVGVAVYRARRRTLHVVASGQSNAMETLPQPPGRPAVSQTPSEWAAQNGIDPRLLQAFIYAERGNLAPIGPRGPLIRFEVHHFLKRLSGAARADADRYFRVTPGVKAWDRGGQQWRPTGSGAWLPMHNDKNGKYLGQNHEYDVFDQARQVANQHGQGHVPYEAISMGFGQIMGFHYKALGYKSAAEQWVDAHQLDGQTRQFIGFLAADPRMVKALQQGDLRTAVSIYNGDGQVDAYLAAANRFLSSGSQFA